MNDQAQPREERQMTTVLQNAMARMEAKIEEDRCSVCGRCEHLEFGILGEHVPRFPGQLAPDAG